MNNIKITKKNNKENNELFPALWRFQNGGGYVIVFMTNEREGMVIQSSIKDKPVGFWADDWTCRADSWYWTRLGGNIEILYDKNA